MRSPFIPKVSDDAFGRTPRGYDDLRRLAARYARDTLAGRTLTNHATQLAITLAPDALAMATRSGAPAALLRAMAELPALLSRALYLRTVADRQRRPEVRRLQILGTRAEIAGRAVELLFVVRENFNGQCFLDRVVERDTSKQGRQEGGGTPEDNTTVATADASDAAETAPLPSNAHPTRIAQSHTPAALVDDQGQPVYDSKNNPLQRPNDVPPSFFVDAGKAAVAADAFSDVPGMTSRVQLLNFGQGGPWDVQRVGSDKLPTPAFVDYATIGIGLYGAAAGIPPNEMLTYENWYAGLNSHFDEKVERDSTYTNLPKRNVDNTKLGYHLYESGRIGPSSTE